MKLLMMLLVFCMFSSAMAANTANLSSKSLNYLTDSDEEGSDDQPSDELPDEPMPEPEPETEEPE